MSPLNFSIDTYVCDIEEIEEKVNQISVVPSDELVLKMDNVQKKV